MELLGKLVRWLDENAEKTVIVVAYGTMTAIIFVEVIRRYLFKEQAAWSTTIPVYLFLWIAWIGAAYNVRKRAHLRFEEFRGRMSYGWQFTMLMMDAILWMVMATIVLKYSIEYVQLLEMNWAIVPGTDSVMQWWFYMATPIGWGLLIVRVFQNVWEDISDFRHGRPLRMSMTLTSD